MEILIKNKMENQTCPKVLWFWSNRELNFKLSLMRENFVLFIWDHFLCVIFDLGFDYNNLFTVIVIHGSCEFKLELIWKCQFTVVSNIIVILVFHCQLKRAWDGMCSTHRQCRPKMLHFNGMGTPLWHMAPRFMFGEDAMMKLPVTISSALILVSWPCVFYVLYYHYFSTLLYTGCPVICGTPLGNI